jgi:hypothetical protein
MGRAKGLLINGLIALTLSLIIWKGTGSFIGWLALAAPGGVLILAGWVRAIYEEE